MEDGLVEIQLGLMMALSSLFFLQNGCHGVDGNGSYLHSDHRAPILEDSIQGAVGNEARPSSIADVARVQAPRDRRVSGAFDNGAAIGKNRQLVGVNTRANREIISADDGERRQTAGQIG
jgi:hypothetical protein